MQKLFTCAISGGQPFSLLDFLLDLARGLLSAGSFFTSFFEGAGNDNVGLSPGFAVAFGFGLYLYLSPSQPAETSTAKDANAAAFLAVFCENNRLLIRLSIAKSV